MRVFLVEDILTVRSIVPDLLCRLGGMQLVGRAKGHASARAWLEQHAHGWDLAVIDLVLDGWWCSDVIGCARTTHGEGRLVVFSSMAAPEVRARCLSTGADAAFPKMQVGDFAAWLDALRRGAGVPSMAPIRTEPARGAPAPALPLRGPERSGPELRKR